MFDESYCAGMALGEPQISVGGLLKFAAALESFTTQTHGARSHPSRRKKTVRRSPYRNPAQLALYPEHQIVERPLSLTPKGLIEALADLLLAAIGTPSGTIKGGDDEQ